MKPESKAKGNPMSTLRITKRRERQAAPEDQRMEPVSGRPSSGSPPRAAIFGDIPVSLSTVAEAPGPAHEQIAERAYQLWEVNGRMMGNDCADWFQAERLLRVEPHHNG
jgi:hypothetical protein